MRANAKASLGYSGDTKCPGLAAPCFVIAVWFLTIMPTVAETIATRRPSLARAFSLECTVAGRDSVVIQRRSDEGYGPLC